LKIVEADEALAAIHESVIPDLVHSTGPSSYDYQFGGRELLDLVVNKSWHMPGTLFSHDACHLAIDDDETAGFMLSFPAAEFRPRGANLSPIWKELVASGVISRAEFGAFLDRVSRASWLNPVTRPGIYYIHAIATRPAYRGKRIGLALLQTAIETAKRLEHSAVELDVLSDNPAVNFYQSMGFKILVESKAPEPFAAGVPVEYRMGLCL
jgi:ribosomal protein S18 acetylase RimI-like enzyme